MSHHHWHGGSVDCFAAQAAWPCPTRKQRSLALCPAISLVPVYPSGSYNHPSRDAHPLAPSGSGSDLMWVDVETRTLKSLRQLRSDLANMVVEFNVQNTRGIRGQFQSTFLQDERMPALVAA